MSDLSSAVESSSLSLVTFLSVKNVKVGSLFLVFENVMSISIVKLEKYEGSIVGDPLSWDQLSGDRCHGTLTNTCTVYKLQLSAQLVTEILPNLLTN